MLRPDPLGFWAVAVDQPKTAHGARRSTVPPFRPCTLSPLCAPRRRDVLLGKTATD